MTAVTKYNLHEWTRTVVLIGGLIWAAAKISSKVDHMNEDLTDLKASVQSIQTSITASSVEDAKIAVELIALKERLDKMEAQ